MHPLQSSKTGTLVAALEHLVAQQMKRAVSRAQQRIVGPLNAAEREQLAVLLAKLIAGHEKAAK